MGRRRSSKLIPNSDVEFAAKAIMFARGIAKDPARFHLSAEDAREMTLAAREFREAISRARRAGTRTKLTVMRKHEVRKETERIFRRYANLIRANPQISAIDKAAIYVHQRPQRLHKRTCPQTAPVLMFIGSKNEAGLTGKKHILRFCESTNPRTLTLRAATRARPAGVARVELFVELIAQDEPTPRHPGELSGGRPWYLGSFNRNPIEVEFPVPSTPMLVVYWARWAGANNDVGPFSQTCVAGTEGGFAAAKAITHQQIEQRRATKCIVTLRPPRELEYADDAALLLEDHSDSIDTLPAQAAKQLPEAA